MNALTLTYQPADPAAELPEDWARVEQERPQSRLANNATFADLARMIAMAAAGLSAHGYQVNQCPAATITADGKIRVELAVYVWPSRAGLQYSLTASMGEFGPAEAVEIERDADIPVDGTDQVTLPWLTSRATAAWTIGCYDEFSRRIAEPAVAIDGCELTLSASCFGALRLRCLAHGFRHSLTIEFQKTVQEVADDPAEVVDNSGAAATSQTPTITGYQAITDVRITAVVRWVGVDGETASDECDIELPECVQELLELCPNGNLAAGNEWNVVGPDDVMTTVYYDACTGGVLDVRHARE